MKAKVPKHCGRPMVAVKDSRGMPIWWCADCHGWQTRQVLGTVKRKEAK